MHGMQSLFSLTLNRDLKGGAVTFVLGRHLAPVAASITGDHFDDLHFVSVDLGRGELFRGEGYDDGLKAMCLKHTFVFLSYVSLNCMCFPALLPRSIHFPFSHFMVGFLVRVVESTFAMKVTSAPAIQKQTYSSCNTVITAYYRMIISIYSDKPEIATTFSGGFSTKSPVSSVGSEVKYGERNISPVSLNLNVCCRR